MRNLFRRGLARLSFRRQVSRSKRITKALLKTGKSETGRIKEALKRETKRFKIEKEIYQISDAEKIVLGKDVTTVEQIKFSKLNLADINTLCKENGIITDSIFKKVNKVRELRNKLHIGTLTVIEKDYSKKDLEFVFSVAREIKKLP